MLSVQLSEATHVIEYRNSHLPWEEVVILNGNRLHQSKALVTLKTKFHFTFEVDDGAAKYPAVIMFKPESTEGGRLVSILKWPEGALLNLG